jgi:nucleotide-binding universal stress UspA family protein
MMLKVYSNVLALVEMPSIKRILFPIDFSERCAQTAPVVAAWARQFEAKVTLLHALELPPGVGDDFSGALYTTLEPEIHKAAEERLAAFAEQHFGSDPVTRVVETGGAGEQVVERARKDHTSLIMMPTHGHGAFRRFLTGSVTSKVLHDAHCPVWTAAHSVSGHPKRMATLRSIVCAADQDASSVALIRWAAWLAKQHAAALKIVHVMPAVDETSRNRGERAVRQFWSTRASAAMTAILKQAGRPQSELMLHGGDIATTLAAAVAQQKGDLLLIGRGHIKKNLGRLRTHSMSIVCKSPCPVLSV